MARSQSRSRRPLGPLTALVVLLSLAVLPGASVATPSASGLRAGEGLLSVGSSPSVATQIRVADHVRNTSQVTGLPLPAGSYRVCFSGPADHITPPCQTAEVNEGELTTIVGSFYPSGTVHVAVEPAELVPEVRIDGVARDRGALTLPLAAGNHEICVEELEEYLPVPCELIAVQAGETIGLTMSYAPVPVEPEVTEPEPSAPGEPDDAGPVPDAEPQPEPESEPTPGLATYDVRLNGAVVHTGRGPQWSASVELAATRDGLPAGSVSIAATWSTGGEQVCTTTAQGACTFTSPAIHNRDKETTFRVVSVDGAPVSGPTHVLER